MKLIKSVAVLAVGALALVGCDSRQNTTAETEGYSTRTEAREMLDTTDTATGAGATTDTTDSSINGAVYDPAVESEGTERSTDAASGAAYPESAEADSSELDTVNANEELGAGSEATDEIDQQAEEERMMESGVFEDNQHPDNTSSEPDPSQLSD